MENSDDVPRVLVQDGRFVKIFCAVLSSSFKTILPLKNPIRRPFDPVFRYLRGAKRELLTLLRKNTRGHSGGFCNIGRDDGRTDTGGRLWFNATNTADFR